ncbi:MAG TPA: dihydrofolate reductase family protein [Bryobacteraceae bacterium]|nr:dihydrofolate reductase family protein [Bryobacteraceae bacterium]
MRRLIVFNNMTVDGYFAGPNGDINWFRDHRDIDFDAFTANDADAGLVLVFGRVTYDLMRSYWPTERALQEDPAVARRMNTLPKIVFSRTMNDTAWSNSTLLKGDVAPELARLKKQGGGDLLILGSGSVVTQCAEAGLIDNYQIVVQPIATGSGQTLFEGLTKHLELRLVETRKLGNGNVFVSYEPAVPRAIPSM